MDTYRAVSAPGRRGAKWVLERARDGGEFIAMDLYFQTEEDALAHALRLVTVEKQRQRTLTQDGGARA